MSKNEGAERDLTSEQNFEAAAPTELIETDERPPSPQPGTALCLSGGGYRAALFHLGAVWALKRAGVLFNLDRIASASGGSIIAGLLAVKWSDIASEAPGSDALFIREIVEPLFRLTSRTVDVGASLARLSRLHHLYDPLVHALEGLYRRRTLQDFPDRPRFVINATNVQSGALWRFMKPRMRDWRVGDIPNPTVRVSQAVAASAAFPPFLSPFILRTSAADFVEGSGRDLRAEKFRRRIVLTDAGVYDNLAIETAWKKYDTLLISDAGWPLPAEHSPSFRWLGHTRRVVGILTHQIATIRQSQVKASFRLQRQQDADGGANPLGRKGAYWSITSVPESYTDEPYWVEDPIILERVRRLPTRLATISRVSKEYLVDWGYFIAAAALKKYMGLPCTQPPPFSRLG